jgi:autotransporter-associated beta strand protein
MAFHNSTWRVAISSLGILAAIACGAPIALGQYTFVQDTVDAIGNWDDVANWTDGASNTTYPNAPDATVLFNNPIKSPSVGTYTLTLPATDVTVGEFKIDNTGFANTNRDVFANNGGKLVFQSTSGLAKYIETPNTGTAPANTQNQIQTDVMLNSDLEITQDNYPNLNTGTIFTGLFYGDSSKTITKKGAGGIQFNYAFALGAGEGYEGKFVVEDGSIRLINSSSAIAKSTGFTVVSGGQLQLADNAGTAVPDYGLASGAVLNLNGPGRAAGQSNPDGALRFGITQSGRTETFHSPVNLQSDSHIVVAAANTFGVFDQDVSGPGDLIMSGAGQLALTNNFSYTGDTQVTSGIVSIANPDLADAADVYMTTGGIFDLGFAATDTIRALYFDGTPQPIGTYGATGSGAANINDAFFTGAGVLNVTTLPVIGVPGDYNNNGVVDGADYVLWRAGGPLQNEVDNVGVVNQQDYVEWRARFGNTSGSGSGTLTGSAAVPEPAMALLATFALTAFMAVTRKR